MENLISSKAVRFLRILELTYLKDETSIEDIMKINACSKNTARSDIEEIHERWKNTLDTEITIVSITVSNIAMATLMDVKQEILIEEISIKLLLNILLNPDFTIHDHSIDLDYSESYLRKIVTVINRFLAYSDSKIVYHKFDDISHPILLSESEVKLHHHLANIVKAANAYDNFEHIKDYPSSHFEIICNKLDLPLTAFLSKDLDVLAKISYLRVSQGYTNNKNLRAKYLEIYSQFDFDNLINLFYEVYNKEVLKKYGQRNYDIFVKYFENSQRVFICIIFKVLISTYNINKILNRDLMFTKRFMIQSNDGYNIMESLINMIDDNFGYNLNEYIGEIGYVAYNLLPSVLSFENYRIGIYSDLSLIHAKTILVFMNSHFPSHNSEVYDKNGNYDFILSTDAKFKHQEAITVAITDLPGQSDIDTIYTALYTSK